VKSVNPLEAIVSGFFAAAALLYLWLVRDMAFGSLTSPKSGFMPIVAGSGALVLSTANLVRLIAGTGRPADRPVDRAVLVKASVFTMALAAYLAIMRFIGFFPSTFILVAVLIGYSTGRRLMPLAVALGTTVASYLVFSLLLGIQFP
jgi:putative tricarboxylic transport membrane protein